MDGPRCQRAGEGGHLSRLAGERRGWGSGSLRGLVNVRPQNVTRNARNGLNALRQRKAGAARTGKNLAQERGSNAKRLRQRRLCHVPVFEVIRKRIHAVFVANRYANGKSYLLRP